MRRLPIIGSAYQPTRLVRRGPTHFTALRAPLTSDDELVQEALLAPRRGAFDTDSMVLAVAVGCALVLGVLIISGVIQL